MDNLCDFRTGPYDYHPSSLSSEKALEIVGCSIFGKNWLDKGNSIFHPAFRMVEAQKVIIDALMSGELTAFVIDYPNVGRNDLNPELFYSHGAYQWLLDGYKADDQYGSLNIQFEKKQVTEFVEKISKEDSVSELQHVDLESKYKTKKRKKRDSSYDWQEFNTELERIYSTSGLPRLQKDLEITMYEWCKNNWKRTPGISTIRGKISDFYTKKGK